VVKQAPRVSPFPGLSSGGVIPFLTDLQSWLFEQICLQGGDDPLVGSGAKEHPDSGCMSDIESGCIDFVA
jgi:hypothetical protein